MDADVCIVGAGYTGLWTAWALLRSQPDLKVVVVEADYPGAGASGRNGGWLSGLLPGDRSRLAEGPGGRTGVVELQRQLIQAVHGVEQACGEESIDADLLRGGTLAVATNAAQLARLRAEVEEDRAWGLTTEDVSLVDPSPRVRIGGAVSAWFNPHCARIQPAKLVRGLAGAVERRGAVIYSGTPVRAIEPGRVVAPAGAVKAPWVVRATEGYTASLPGTHRALLPMNSSMIVTTPLSETAWDQIGWDGCETIRDGAHAYVYLQRTADGRIAIGGRGRPYRYGSRLRSVGDTPASTAAALAQALERLFPPLARAGFKVDAAWSGVLGVARDWCPSVGVQSWPPGPGRAEGGLAWAGGYVGDGVATSHLAGLTVADLILGRATDRTRLPWVGRRSRAWEPEPLRWLGVHSVYAMYRAADRAEARHPDRASTPAWASLASALAGRH